MTRIVNLKSGGRIEVWRDEDELIMTAEGVDNSKPVLNREDAGDLIASIQQELGFHVEPVIDSLISELERKQQKEPCREGALIITKLQEAKHWQTHRMARIAAERAAGTRE